MAENFKAQFCHCERKTVSLEVAKLPSTTTHGLHGLPHKYFSREQNVDFAVMNTFL